MCTLLHDLAALYLKMKKYGEAAETLDKAVEASRAQRGGGQGQGGAGDTYGVEDVHLLQLDVKSHTLLSKVHRAMEAHEPLLASLNTAYTLQSQLLQLLPSASPLVAGEKEVSAGLAHELAVYYQTHQSNHEQAVLYYHEALKASPSSLPSLLSLSQLHFALNDFDAAQATLTTLLRVSPHHKTASLLLAEIMYERHEHDQAIYHFTSLLSNDGQRFDALAKNDRHSQEGRPPVRGPALHRPLREEHRRLQGGADGEEGEDRGGQGGHGGEG